MRMFITTFEWFQSTNTNDCKHCSRQNFFPVLLLINTCKHKKKNRLENSSKIWVEEKFPLHNIKISTFFMLKRFFQWRGVEREKICMNEYNKEINLFTTKLYVTTWKKTNLCFPLVLQCWCVCVHEREARSLDFCARNKNGAGSLCISFNAWTFCWEHDWLASLISFTFSGRENSTGRKLVWDETVLVKSFQWIFQIFSRKWNFTQNVKCLT